MIFLFIPGVSENIMLIYQSKVVFDVSILFGKIHHHFRPGNQENCGNLFVLDRKSRLRFWSIIYLSLKFEVNANPIFNIGFENFISHPVDGLTFLD